MPRVRSVTEPGHSFKAHGAQWWETTPTFAHAVLPTGFVSVRQHADAGLWRVQCFDGEDELAYLGGPEYKDRDEAMEMAIAISEELASRRK